MQNLSSAPFHSPDPAGKTFQSNSKERSTLHSLETIRDSNKVSVKT